MRFLMVNTDYRAFVDSLYADCPGLEQEPYAVQLRARDESLFGTADFYSTNLRALGHEAEDVHANNERLQRAWAREHGLRVLRDDALTTRVTRRLRRLGGRPATGWLERILAEQIRRTRPDVLLVLDVIKIDPRFLREMRPYVRLLVGQHAAVPLKHDDHALRVYDLVLSSFQPMVDELHRRGVPAVLHRLAFEPRVLDRMGPERTREVVTFVGSLYPRIHESRIRLLETVASELDDRFELWAPNLDAVDASSPLRDRWCGTAWGRRMYEILRDSAVTVNEHGSIAPFANNCRLYEATGVGTALVTDWKPNLADLFAPGAEVAAYRSADECVELLIRYLGDPDARAALASAGQQRTLREHTYTARMEELVEIVEPRLGQRAA
jgi:hypothetical protein